MASNSNAGSGAGGGGQSAIQILNSVRVIPPNDDPKWPYRRIILILEQKSVEIDKVTEEDIDSMCLFVFQFDEVHENIMTRGATLELAIDGLYDSRITNLKKTTRSPDSNKLKQIKFVTRKSLELEELINDRKMELHEVRLLKIKLEAALRSNVSVLSQYAAREEEGSMIGYLARIMRME